MESLLLYHGNFNEKETIEILIELCNGFKSLERLNIIHRDLKLVNILLKERKIKIGDFGFCKQLKNKNDKMKTQLGSPLYMAPELLKGQEYNYKVDIWSLGVVVYELLHGHCPFQG